MKIKSILQRRIFIPEGLINNRSLSLIKPREEGFKIYYSENVIIPDTALRSSKIFKKNKSLHNNDLHY